jgi:hypothetical protein
MLSNSHCAFAEMGVGDWVWDGYHKLHMKEFENSLMTGVWNGVAAQ